jgi:hypothetical protein
MTEDYVYVGVRYDAASYAVHDVAIAVNIPSSFASCEAGIGSPHRGNASGVATNAVRRSIKLTSLKVASDFVTFCARVVFAK